MRNGHLLFSAIQFLLVTALFALGAVFFGLHYLSYIRKVVAAWILDPSNTFFLFGILTISIAFLLGICFWAMQRGSFVRIRMERGNFHIDESLIQNTLQEFWEKNLPEEKKPTEIYCAGQKIEIITEDQDQDLEALEYKLSTFLSEKFGYEKEFFVTLTRIQDESFTRK